MEKVRFIMGRRIYCFIKHRAMTYWWSGGIGPRILIFGIGGGGQLHAPAALLPRKEPPVPIG